MKHYPIPAPVFEGTVRYLATRPWAEVAEVMSHLHPIMTAGPVEPATEGDLLAQAIASGQVSDAQIIQHAEAGEYAPASG